MFVTVAAWEFKSFFQAWDGSAVLVSRSGCQHSSGDAEHSDLFAQISPGSWAHNRTCLVTKVQLSLIWILALSYKMGGGFFFVLKKIKGHVLFFFSI